jgi:trehalose/maltose hydrolase-like predicted phosphorylase
MDEILISSQEPSWGLRTEGYDALREDSLQSRFAIGNGFYGVRGGREITRGEADGGAGEGAYISPACSGRPIRRSSRPASRRRPTG